MAGDVVILACSVMTAFVMRYPKGIPPVYHRSILILIPVLAGLMILVYSVYELYTKDRRPWRDLRSRLVAAYTVFAISSMAVFFILREFSFPRPAVLLIYLLMLPFQGAWHWLGWRMALKATGRKQVLVISIDSGHALAEKLKESWGPYLGEVRILCPSKPEWVGSSDGGISDIEVAVAQADVIVLDNSLSATWHREISERCFAQKKELLVVPGLYEIMLSESKLTQIDDIPVFAVDTYLRGERTAAFKRMLDLAVAGTLLTGTIPLFVLIGLIIKLDSPGPVFYVQERVGHRGRTFKLYKFRTMVHDAEALTGPVWSSGQDPRVTRVGRFLRATRLDELPQLVNVLRGDMSLVGPRPERPVFVEKFAQEIPYYEERLRVPGGITGLAQVLGRYSTSPRDKLTYDLLYARKASLGFDLLILLKTVHAMIDRRKAV